MAPLLQDCNVGNSEITGVGWKTSTIERMEWRKLSHQLDEIEARYRRDMEASIKQYSYAELQEFAASRGVLVRPKREGEK